MPPSLIVSLCGLLLSVAPPGRPVEWFGPRPYRIEPRDVLLVRLSALKEQRGGAALPFPKRELVVGDNGSIDLGGYGTVAVAGLPLSKAALAVEERINVPGTRVSVDLLPESKVCWVVVEDAAEGTQTYRAERMTNDTVLDVLAMTQGVLETLSGKQIWISRRQDPPRRGPIILPVDLWGQGLAATNHVVLHGDEIHVSDHPPKPAGHKTR